MPYLQDSLITKAWRHAGEHDRIHFMFKLGKTEKHLYVDKTTKGGLYGMLDAHLLSLGYTGPASAKESERVGHGDS